MAVAEADRTWEAAEEEGEEAEGEEKERIKKRETREVTRTQ